MEQLRTLLSLQQTNDTYTSRRYVYTRLADRSFAVTRTPTYTGPIERHPPFVTDPIDPLLAGDTVTLHSNVWVCTPSYNWTLVTMADTSPIASNGSIPPTAPTPPTRTQSRITSYEDIADIQVNLAERQLADHPPVLDAPKKPARAASTGLPRSDSDSSSSLVRSGSHPRCLFITHPTEPSWVGKLIAAAERKDTAWIDKHLDLLVSMEQRVIVTIDSKQKLVELGLWGRVRDQFQKLKQQVKQPPNDMVFGQPPYVNINWSHTLDPECGTVTFKINRSRLTDRSVHLSNILQCRQSDQLCRKWLMASADEELVYLCHEQLRYQHIVKYLQFLELDFFGNPRANAIVSEFPGSLVCGATHFKDTMTVGIVIQWANMHLQDMTMELLMALTQRDQPNWLRSVFKGWTLKQVASVMENTFNRDKRFGRLWREVSDRVLGVDDPSTPERELNSLDEMYEAAQEQEQADKAWANSGFSSSSSSAVIDNRASKRVAAPAASSSDPHPSTESHVLECLACQQKVRLHCLLSPNAQVKLGDIRAYVAGKPPVPRKRKLATVSSGTVGIIDNRADKRPAAELPSHPLTADHVYDCEDCNKRFRQRLHLPSDSSKAVFEAYMNEYIKLMS